METNTQPDEALLRLEQVLDRFQIGRSTWYAGIKRGIYPAPINIYPAPIKIGRRTALWRASDIERLIASLSA
jgi:prophage regulatory protein